MADYIRQTAEGFFFKIYVQPRASRNSVAGVHGDALKIRLTAPPVDGAANKMCLQYLAKLLKAPRSALKIESGHNSRTKRILCRCEAAKGAKTGFTAIKKRLEALYRK